MGNSSDKGEGAGERGNRQLGERGLRQRGAEIRSAVGLGMISVLARYPPLRMRREPRRQSGRSGILTGERR